MKIVHISSSDVGGAAISCIRSHYSLLEAGIDSNLVTLSKKRNDIPNHFTFNEPNKLSLFQKLKIRLRIEKLLYKKHHNSLENKVSGFEHFSFPESEYDLTNCDLIKKADIINLHWVSGFIDYSFLKKINKPVVWTLHDMNAFTGGCHYSSGCNGYEKNCAVCPQLSGTIDPALTKKHIDIKKSNIKNVNLTIVTPSEWLYKCAKASLLFKEKPVHLIPYSLNLDTFRSIDKLQARQQLKLPLDKKIILFVSHSIENQRKGLDILLQSLSIINESKEYILCSVGKSNVFPKNDNYVTLGEIKDEKQMMLAYNAADVFVLPSKEDNLPNVAIESIACGVPVIGFNIGGMPDIVEDGVNGLLCNQIDPIELSKTIRDFFSGSLIFDREKIRLNAEKKYTNRLQSNRYISLYHKLLGKS